MRVMGAMLVVSMHVVDCKRYQVKIAMMPTLLLRRGVVRDSL